MTMAAGTGLRDDFASDIGEPGVARIGGKLQCTHNSFGVVPARYGDACDLAQLGACH